MKTDLKEINSYTRQLDVTVEWDSIENEFQEEFNKARLKYNIPGFRKGKVPKKIVKKKIGQIIYIFLLTILDMNMNQETYSIINI